MVHDFSSISIRKKRQNTLTYASIYLSAGKTMAGEEKEEEKNCT